MYQMHAHAVVGLAEVYSTPADGFTDAPELLGRMHPICVQSALTDLEQDVEMELRRRGFEFTGQTFNSRKSLRITPATWALKPGGLQLTPKLLNMSVERIADKIQEECK